jgi:transposase
MGRKCGEQPLTIVNPDCAGIDVGASVHYVAVDPARDDEPVRRFLSFTDELEEMARWLKACAVRVVAMEATGVYWIPVYEVLDRAGLEVHLVNPKATKQVSGRKSDVLDCQWIRQLMCYGLLKGAFRPPDRICELRAYVRQRARLTQDAARSVQHMQKALTEMNIQLDRVLSDITGKTGLSILRAIVAGEREPAVLASWRDRRVKADEATIARSLEGTWRAEHLFALGQALARYDFYGEQIRQCEAEIKRRLDTLALEADLPEKPMAGRNPSERELRAALRAMLGVDLTAIPTIAVETALVVASEIGPDLSRFPTSQHFCSWANVAPGTRISGGKKLPGRSQPRVNKVGQALRMAASTAANSNSFIGAAHRARLARMDKPRAIKATAHHLARLIYAMLTRGEEYVERGIEHFEAERHDRRLKALRRNARSLGFTLTEMDQKSAA